MYKKVNNNNNNRIHGSDNVQIINMADYSVYTKGEKLLTSS